VEDDEFVGRGHTCIGKQDERASITLARPSQLTFRSVYNIFLMHPRAAHVILSLDDVDAPVVEEFMRAGYSEHHIFVHLTVELQYVLTYRTNE